MSNCTTVVSSTLVPLEQYVPAVLGLGLGSVRRIISYFGPLGVDLFASHLTTQCQAYLSWWLDPYGVATNGLRCQGYANLPSSMIGTGQVSISNLTDLS